MQCCGPMAHPGGLLHHISSEQTDLWGRSGAHSTPQSAQFSEGPEADSTSIGPLSCSAKMGVNGLALEKKIRRATDGAGDGCAIDSSLPARSRRVLRKTPRRCLVASASRFSPKEQAKPGPKRYQNDQVKYQPEGNREQIHHCQRTKSSIFRSNLIDLIGGLN
jgi:hypothetical protein